MTYSKLGLANNGLMVKVTFWWSSWILKIIPCAFMTYFCLALARMLRQATRRRQRMLSHRRASGASTTSIGSQADQKTRMLLAILFCYLASVLPFGITVPLVGVLGRPFKTNVFDPLFIVFDLFGLVNSLTTFVLLISMSRVFRETFYKMFWPKETVERGTTKAVASNSTADTRSNRSGSQVQPESPLSLMIAELNERVIKLDT